MDINSFQSKLNTDPVVSISRSVILDLETAVTILSKFYDKNELVFLESASISSSADSALSYFGFDAYKQITCTMDSISIHTQGSDTPEVSTENLYDVFGRLLDTYKLKPNESEAYFSGIMGYMGYECVKYLEEISFPDNRELASPVGDFIIPKSVIIFNNVSRSATVIRNVFREEVSESLSVESIFESENMILDEMINTLKAPLSEALPPIQPISRDFDKDLDLESYANIQKDEFMKKVEICKDYIARGHVFQIQVGRRMKMPQKSSPLTMYRYLRFSNPSKYMFFIKLNGVCLLGSSPELLVVVDGKEVTIKPLAGTRRRYSSTKTEDEIVDELLADKKEQAEHVMLVDLARNDIGKAAKYGTVKVTDLMSVEKYAHVMHIVSNVIGELKDDKTALDAFKFGFPAGTVTGTPKIRAMEIISELETVQREFYSGGIVFFDFQGNLKSTLTIRSILVKDNYTYTQASAGIVADSKPELEFLETQNKMKSSLQAMTIEDTDYDSRH